MQAKALHFGDMDSAEQVMATADPVRQKQIGKQVKNFNHDSWEEVAPEIIAQGLLAKFTQVPHCKKFLQDTKDKAIGEANRNDSYWGIGMGLQDSEVWDQKKWGKSLLGKSLMEIRGKLHI